MTDIAAAQVKSLREATGFGMMECKKALVESGGDFEGAQQLLRVRSQSKAGKVAGRSTGEGRVCAVIDGSAGAIVQVNCETDFVAKDRDFSGFAEKLCRAVLEADGDDLQSIPQLEEERQELVLKLGENVVVKKAVRLEAPEGGALASYIHQGSRIGVLAAISPASEAEGEFGRGLCMQIAAMRPGWIKPDDVPAEVLDKERGVFLEQQTDSDKPDDVKKRIVEGKIGKFLEESCLVSQPFLIDEDKTVGQALSDRKTSLEAFARLEIGG